MSGVSEGAYSSRDEYLQDVLGLYQQMLHQLKDAGTRYVQLDSPRYSRLVKDEGRANLRRVWIDPSTWLKEMIVLDKQLIDSRSSSSRCGTGGSRVLRPSRSEVACAAREDSPIPYDARMTARRPAA